MSAPVDSGAPDAVVTQRDPGIMVITINRPDQRNAMTKAAAHIIADALRDLDSRSDLGAAVITGAGGSFCAGMDLKRFAAGELPRTEVGGFAGFVEAPPKKPLIAAVEGWALGGGFEIVLACDLVVAAAGARFGLPEVRRGLIARGGGVVRLPRRLPRAIALEAILTGEPLSAQTAASFGMVNTVVPDGDALDAAVDLARRISVNAPLAVAASKQIVDESEDWPRGELFSRQQAISDPVFASHDAAEGAAAFAQKRAPVWTGR
ncbi:carnitinyl-CoA dehydratase CaiD [Gordonia polyisoprenivorans VH2]|uniref:Carnitinyl-CoA dehydratase CaiD n=1 Tax=Gordonia polyisoprenivorans (strain DSM 44266 / VH2) TaxID=1112204 RepID=H6N3S9_GORPV|nr:crotonase/enoyl-CoA hydratase family protein [Gordonia polyisoprenivorans]AFA73550.1 carnitinyl-CoA dehydratase CaiD [Gordonia polyisoprenivorans VH2]